MTDKEDYIRDIAEMRSLMERSSKFLSLSGLAGVMAGIYALSGAYLAYTVYAFKPDATIFPGSSGSQSFNLLNVIILAISVLVLAVSTAVFLSWRKAAKRGEKLWNPTARRLLVHLAVPLVAGGLLILILISKDMTGLIAPFTLIFYGLALYSASKFTYEEVRSLGLIEIGLGLFGAYFVEYGLICWAIGFGAFHVIYGIYMHYRYER